MMSNGSTLARVDDGHSGASPADDFPRVLIVSHSSINEHDQHAVSFRSWFAEWPRERLAQIYSGHEVGEARFCGHTFKLGPDERRFGRLFFRLKGSSIGLSGRAPVTMTAPSGELPPRVTWPDLLARRISALLVDSGVWEPIFRPVLSDRLKTWVQMFGPDVIYVQGYMLSFAWLAQMLQKAFMVPICFQTGDDWPAHLYDNSFIAPAIRPVVKKTAASLIRSASVAIVNGEAMAVEYRKRYGSQFTPVMMCDSVARFRAATPKRVAGPGHVSVVYSGNLAHGRWRLLADVCAAGSLLETSGHNVSVTAFVSTVPKEAMSVLGSIPNLQVLPAPRHEDVPSLLKGADILFLPETFDPVESERVRLSISTKAHFYMMSEKPVLVYGSPVTGIVEYAKREEWALVVDRRDSAVLVEALRKLIEDPELRRRLVDRGIEVASRNHEQGVVRRRFLQHMRRAAGWADVEIVT